MNLYRILANLQDAREEINADRSEMIEGSYGGFDKVPYQEHLDAIKALEEAENKVKILAGINVPEEAEYILGYSTYGGFEEVYRTKSKPVAEEWVARPSQLKDCIRTYSKVTLNAPVSVDT